MDFNKLTVSLVYRFKPASREYTETHRLINFNQLRHQQEVHTMCEVDERLQLLHADLYESLPEQVPSKAPTACSATEQQLTGEVKGIYADDMTAQMERMDIITHSQLRTKVPPSFDETGIKCLDDSAEHKMTTEDTCSPDRERSQMVQVNHDEAVSMSLFANSRDSSMPPSDMFLDQGDPLLNLNSSTEYRIVNSYVRLSPRWTASECEMKPRLSRCSFSGHMDRVAARYKMSGPQNASALLAHLLSFGQEESSEKLKALEEYLEAILALRDVFTEAIHADLCEDGELSKSQHQRKDSTNAMRYEDTSKIWSPSLPQSSIKETRLVQAITGTAGLTQFMLKRFTCSKISPLSTSIFIILAHVKGALGQQAGNGKEIILRIDSNGKSRSFLESLSWWILWIVILLMVPVIGPRARIPNETGTSFMLAFVFAISKSMVGSTDVANFWTIMSSGISFGSSVWLATATMSCTNSIFVHIVRYIGLAMLLYDTLCNTKLGDKNRQLDLSMTIPELSVLGSVLINALYNEKIKQLVGLMESIWGGILAIFRLQRIPADDIERSPRLTTGL